MSWLGGDMTPTLPRLGDMFARSVAARDPWMTAEIARWLQRAGALPAELPPVAGPHQLALAGDWHGAADAWKERGNQYEAALALIDAYDPVAVREAFEILSQLGANGVLPIAVQRLRSLGAPVPRGPRQSTAANAGGLTAREAEVADLLGEGLTNAQIAGRLVLSEKTVGHHVS